MKQMPTNLLALFARRKEVGYALIINGALYRYGVTRIRAKGNGPDFIKAVVQPLNRLLAFMGSEGLVVIEPVDRSHKPPMPKSDIPHIVKSFIEGVYAVKEIPLSDIKQCWCGAPNVTHGVLAEAIVRQYPMLERRIKDARPYKAKYWQKAIIAVAMAEVAKSGLKSGKKQERITKVDDLNSHQTLR